MEDNRTQKDDIDYEEVAKKLIELSFANSMAYTKTVAAENPIERMERIEKALQEVDRMDAMSLELLRRTPRPLD